MNFCSTGQETGELSVDKDEIVGIINEDTEDDMWLVSMLNKPLVLAEIGSSPLLVWKGPRPGTGKTLFEAKYHSSSEVLVR